MHASNTTTPPASEFWEPNFITKDVTTYRDSHAQGWIDLEDLLDGAALRQLCVHPGDQNSFRRLKLDEFRASIATRIQQDVFPIIDVAAKQIAGGHAVRSVRIRIGQARFRSDLIKRYENVCAFSGRTPEIVLDACHLYSYAEVGEHKDQGGLLLRKDLHRLFDSGYIVVDSHGTILVSPVLHDYPQYKALHGEKIHVEPTPKQRSWLREHHELWAESDKHST